MNELKLYTLRSRRGKNDPKVYFGNAGTIRAATLPDAENYFKEAVLPLFGGRYCIEQFAIDETIDPRLPAERTIAVLPRDQWREDGKPVRAEFIGGRNGRQGCRQAASVALCSVDRIAQP